jgi:hypothetical protein
VTGDPDEASDTGGADRSVDAGRLQAVQGPVAGHEPMPPVHLLREWKGLLPADLLRLELVERLPGQVRSALRHIEAGQWQEAEQALPGHWAPVLSGPWQRRSRRPWLAFGLLLVAVLCGVLLAEWMVA